MPAYVNLGKLCYTAAVSTDWNCLHGSAVQAVCIPLLWGSSCSVCTMLAFHSGAYAVLWWFQAVQHLQSRFHAFDGLSASLNQRLWVQELCPTLPNGSKIVINLSGRGDKDVHTAAKHLDISMDQ